MLLASMGGVGGVGGVGGGVRGVTLPGVFMPLWSLGEARLHSTGHCHGAPAAQAAGWHGRLQNAYVTARLKYRPTAPS